MAFIFKRKYKVTLPDGTVKTRKCRNWTIQYRDKAGKLRRLDGSTDLAVAKARAAKLERNILRGEEGLVDPFAEHRAKPTREHVADYLADLRAGGADPMYVYNVEHRLTRLVKECGWDTLDDIEPNSFLRWRDAERSETSIRKARLGKGASATTLNQYLDTARAFTNWCATQNRMKGVPVSRRTKRGTVSGKMAEALAGVRKVDGEKRRKRRALSEREIAKLIAAAPAERSIVYRFGIATGLRRQEITDLVWGDVRLNAIRPYLALRAEATKARRDDRVPLPESLAGDLRKLRGGAKDGERVFPQGVPSMELWREDLKAAGIAEKDDRGWVADFHGGTRKTLNTRLSASGLPLVARMRLMRVTDPRLVNETYHDDSQLGLDALALPEVAAASKPDAAQAAGA